MAISVPLARPDLTELECQEVLQVLRTPVLSIGPKVKELEEMFAAYTRSGYAVAASSGTAALHLALLAAGIRPGDEVITTPFTFAATVNCILYTGAVPVFADIDPESLNLNPTQALSRITDRTTAILPVDVFGHPVDMAPLGEAAAARGLKIIHDACESLGSTYLERPSGSGASSQAAVYSFYPNKQITTGEGGILVTDDPAVRDLARSLRNQGRAEEDHWLLHHRLGYNYRMDELSAALGVAQMKRLEEILARRAQVQEWYRRRLADLPGVTLPCEAGPVRVSWFVYAVRFDEAIDRDGMINLMQRKGVQCRPYFPPVHLQPYLEHLGYREGDFPAAEAAGRSLMAIPFSGVLSEGEVDYVSAALRETVSSI